MEASWAGGTKGREVMDRLFVQVSSLLSEIGVFYVVILKDNDPGASVAVLWYSDWQQISVLLLGNQRDLR